MPAPTINLTGSRPGALAAGIDKLTAELGIAGDFPQAVLDDADRSAARQQTGPDLTGIDFITIDPPPSQDLDQAMCIQRDGDGYVVYYAIDDIAAWVTPGGAMDEESHRRGQTAYLPDERIGLYPPRIAEDAASLLAEDPPRPAIVWTLRLDATGAVTSATCARGLIRNRRKMSYPEVQQLLDAGQGFETINLLKEVGELRLHQEQQRGGISLPLPEQEIVDRGHGDWTLEFSAPLPVENWNAQISLMTGIAAAEIMLRGKVGLLRTLPPADPGSVAKLRQAARVLRIDWPDAMSYPDFVRSLDPKQPAHLAMLNNCTTLFRGAAYVAFNGTVPDGNLEHSALACHYAHVTAPLRRLIDRYTLEICVCLCAGQPVPQWVLDKLDALPKEMGDSDRREKKFERGLADLVEALVLSTMVGQTFRGIVTELDEHRHVGDVVIEAMGVEGTFTGDAPVGQEIAVRLTAADVATGRTTFVPA